MAEYDESGEIIRLIRGEAMSEGERLTLDEFTDKEHTPSQNQIYGTGHNWSELVAAAGIQPFNTIDSLAPELYSSSPFNPSVPEEEYDIKEILSETMVQSTFEIYSDLVEGDLEPFHKLQAYTLLEEAIIRYDPEDINEASEEIDSVMFPNLEELVDDIDPVRIVESYSKIDYPIDLLPNIVEKKKNFIDSSGLPKYDELLTENRSLRRKLDKVQGVLEGRL